MPARFRAHLTYANVMASVAVFIALGSGAYAASGGSFLSSSGMINGCVPKRGGPLQVLTPGKKCPKGDAALRFNQQGPVGPAGHNGANGTNGMSGTNGTNGTNGGPGPTASAYATTSAGVNITSAQNLVPVLTATITTTFASRIVANGSFAIQRTSGNGNVRCVLEIAPSPFSTFTPISHEDAAYFDGTAVGPFETTIPVTGAALEPAGTYHVQAQCETGSNASLSYGDITAVATAQ